MKKFMFFLNFIILISMCSIVMADGSPVTIDYGASEGFRKAGNVVLGYVQWFGYAIAIAMLIYVGIKYTMAPANEKADLKKSSINYIIGAIIICASTAIFTLLVSVGGDVVGTGTGELPPVVKPGEQNPPTE